MKWLVEVVIVSRGSGINKKFHYLAKEGTRIGQRVRVPFGKGNSFAEGIVTALVDKETDITMKYVETNNLSSKNSGGKQDDCSNKAEQDSRNDTTEKEDEKNRCGKKAVAEGDSRGKTDIVYKEILEYIDDEPIIDEISLEIAKYISEEYLCSFQEAIALFFPKGEKAPDEKRKLVISRISVSEWDEYIARQRKNAVVKKKIAELLRKYADVFWDEIRLEVCANPSTVLKQMETEGVLELVVQEVQPSIVPSEIKESEIVLTEEQQRVVQSVFLQEQSIENNNCKFCCQGNTEKQKIEEDKFSIQKKVNSSEQIDNGRKEKVVFGGQKPFLLYGVTGSGKTEVYIELIRRTVAQGRQAIVLVPEISLTPQTITRFQTVFGNRVAVMHSALTEKEKKTQWQKMVQGQCSIAIGPRSALFVPFFKVGIIIIDECHEDAYKSEKSPRYDAVELGVFMAKKRNATILLGTATPTIQQLYQCERGDLHLLKLSQRSNGAKLPAITLVDMREELKNGNNSLISRYLYRRMEENLNQGNQTLLFLNKRGFSKNLTCVDCGYVHKCPNCDITLSYHKEEGVFKCHYCNHRSKYVRTCPVCGGVLKDISFGTQKIEEEIQTVFPHAKILRIDKDTTQKRGEHQRKFEEFARGEKNILIGTQMIGKGLDFPNVTLVGILQADQSMDIPDFRGTEKTFQMLEQVSGRAGRGKKDGEAVIQSYHTENSIFSYLKNRDYQNFYKDELEIRKAFSYPPYGDILRILITSDSTNEAAETAKKIQQALRFYFAKRGIGAILLGPAPCLINRIEGRYRWQIILKINDKQELSIVQAMIRYIQTEKRNLLYGKHVIVIVEKNPHNIM